MKETTSEDGTTIAYYRMGRGPRVWLMPPAMGAPRVAMEPLLARFAESHTVVTWDMRGFYASGAPKDREAYGVEHHLADLDAVRRAAGLERFVLGGWSMAVQLSLAHYVRDPGSVSALVLINGAYESVLDSVVLDRWLAAALSGALDVASRAAIIANPLARRVLGLRGIPHLMARLGILAHPTPHMEAALQEFRKVDWERYVTVMNKLHEHSAAHALARVQVPTLITAGGRDRMTPLDVASRLCAGIADSELFVIDEGTHYMPQEFPDALGDRIAAFLAGLG